ncbi:TPA: hypothetical protein ACXIQO_002025 [Neisseria meningitidis]
MNITLGRNHQINCDEKDLYKFIGYLANHPNDVNLVFEKNSVQGAWGDEGRIQFFSSKAQNIFVPLGFKFTAGVGNIAYRLNCNELFEMLSQLGFVFGGKQNLSTIKANIPSQFHAEFDAGANM